MALYPTPWTIQLRRYLGEVEGPKGTRVKAWADPEPARVYSVAPVTLTEPDEAGRTIVLDTLSVLAPPEVKVSAYDRVEWLEDTYEVEGTPANWTTGPFGFEPGLEITLKKVNG